MQTRVPPAASASTGPTVIFARNVPMPEPSPAQARGAQPLLFSTPEQLLRDVLAHNNVLAADGIHAQSLSHHTVPTAKRHRHYYIDVHVGTVRLQVSKQRYKRYTEGWRLLEASGMLGPGKYRSPVIHPRPQAPLPVNVPSTTTPPLRLSPRGGQTRISVPRSPLAAPATQSPSPSPTFGEPLEDLPMTDVPSFDDDLDAPTPDASEFSNGAFSDTSVEVY